ncbi:MAG TPA: Mth938-like domain-containing protein [Caulobacteraceae bacterium]|nr:Mth938-like domain-containing protein [Caulobacteraceae bacterium]
MREPPAIEGFGGGGFRVAGAWRPGSLLIVGDVPQDWRPASLAAVTLDDLRPVLDAPPGSIEFLLLGTGLSQALPPRLLREAVRGAGLGLEFMATGPAAKLHNVLASEGRLLATALIAV